MNDSFYDPLDYYKKLTRALAEKNNLKINMKNIPGAYQNRRRSQPLITEKMLNEQFINKYKDSGKEKPNDGKQQSPPKRSTSSFFKRPLTNALAGQAKKKRKKEEPWMNLSESYCRGINIDFMMPPPKQKAPKLLDPEAWLTANRLKKQVNQLNPTAKKPSLLESLAFQGIKENKKPFISQKKTSQQNPPSNSNNFQKNIPMMFQKNIELDPTDTSWNDQHLSNFEPESYFKLPPIPKPAAVVNFQNLKTPDTANVSFMTVNSVSFKPKTASTPLDRQRTTPEYFYPLARPSESKVENIFKLAGVVAEKKLNSGKLVNLPDPLKEIRGKIMDIYDIFSKKGRIINDTLVSYAQQINSEDDPFGDKTSLGNDDMIEPSEFQTPKPKQKLLVPEFYEEAKKTSRPLIKPPELKRRKLPVPTFYDKVQSTSKSKRLAVPSKVQNSLQPSPTNTEKLFGVKPKQQKINKKVKQSIWIDEWLLDQPDKFSSKDHYDEETIFCSPAGSESFLFGSTIANDEDYFLDLSEESDDFNPFSLESDNENPGVIDTLFIDKLSSTVQMSPSNPFDNRIDANFKKPIFKDQPTSPIKQKIDANFLSSLAAKHKIEAIFMSPPHSSKKERKRKSQRNLFEATFIRDFNQHAPTLAEPSLEKYYKSSPTLFGPSSTVDHLFK